MTDHAAAASLWIHAHPRAMELFEALALRRAGRGQRFGMKQLAEVVRWEMAFRVKAGDLFKIDNSHVSSIARHLIAKHPHLSDYIETRRTAGEPWSANQ